MRICLAFFEEIRSFVVQIQNKNESFHGNAFFCNNAHL